MKMLWWGDDIKDIWIIQIMIILQEGPSLLSRNIKIITKRNGFSSIFLYIEENYFSGKRKFFLISLINYIKTFS